MMKILITGLILCLCIVGGCKSTRPNKKNITYLARVGSSYLTLKEAKENISGFSFSQDSAYSLAFYRDEWIHRQLLLKEARKKNLLQQNEVKKKLRDAHNDVLVNELKKLVTAKYKSRASMSNREAIQYYNKNKKKLILKERYIKFRHVKTHTLGDARRARAMLQNDSAWTFVARKFSLNPNQQIYHSKQYWPISSVLRNISIMKKYAATLDSAQISPIQRYKGVYHFIQIMDILKQGTTANPAWFTDQLKEWFMREKQRNYYDSYVKNLYLTAKRNNEIEVYNVSTPTINDKIDSIDTHK